MHTSVVDQVFGPHEAVAPTGMQRGGRGIRKPSPLNPNRGAFRMTDVPPAAMGTQLMTDRAVHLLSTIEVCTKRLGQLGKQLSPLPAVGPAYRSLGDPTPRRDPIEQAVYDEERDRLQQLIAVSRDELDALYRFSEDEVGPPLDLRAVVASRKAALQAEMLEERMAGLTTPSMEDDEPPRPGHFAPNIPRDYHEPVDEAPAYAPTNPHLGGLSDYVHHGDTPPAFRSLA